MSQHDLTIDNQGFPAFRADLNNALQALGSTQSGTTAPSPTFANQLWYDTTNNQLKIRNEDNDAWITLLTLDQSGDVVSQLSSAIVALAAGSASSPSLTATGDTNTGLFFPTADTVGFAGGGTERARINANGYFKASNSGSYGNATGSFHEFFNDGNTETLVVRNSNASFNQEAFIINADRNTTNNSYYFLRANVPNVGTRMLVADSGAIGTAGGISLGDIIPPTSGIGIKFPASQSASSDANTLDDYEEGTFTPNMTFGGAAAFSSVTASGKYTKIGNCVTFEIQFSSYTKTANTGNAQITNMPFSFSDLQKVYIAQGDNLTYTSGAFLFCYNNGSGTDLNPYQQAAGSATNLTHAAFGNGGTFRVCGLYFTT